MGEFSIGGPQHDNAPVTQLAQLTRRVERQRVAADNDHQQIFFRRRHSQPGSVRVVCGRRVEVRRAGRILDDPAAFFSVRLYGASADRHLAVATRYIEHIARLAQPGYPATQYADETLPLVDPEPEMRGAAREIG